MAPLPLVKQEQLCFRRPQQLTGICRDVGFETLRLLILLDRSSCKSVGTLFFCLRALAATLFVARCFLTDARTRRRSSSPAARDSNFARGSFAALTAALRCLRSAIPRAMAALVFIWMQSRFCRGTLAEGEPGMVSTYFAFRTHGLEQSDVDVSPQVGTKMATDSGYDDGWWW